jgi:hypothetical protein
MSTIGKLVGIESPIPHIHKNIDSIPKESIVDSELMFGVELEIENVPHWDSLEINGMTSTTDGSLRNHGREFLLLPSTYPNAAVTLTEFFKRGKFTDKNYSDRTSIHVHTNCLDLKIDELQTILFLYQATESLLFNWVNPERANNIFCVPWSQTNLSYQIFDGKRDIRKFKTWAKYTALNLLTLYNLGTIEWRHMHGHCDVEKLLKWLQIISCFYRYARRTPIDQVKEFLLQLNTSSHYNLFVDMVFMEHADFILGQHNWREQLEENTLMLKYAINTETPKKEISKTKTAILDDIPEEVNVHVDALAAGAGGAEQAVNPQPEPWPVRGLGPARPQTGNPIRGALDAMTPEQIRMYQAALARLHQNVR